MSVDERGRAAAEDLLLRVSGDVDAQAMLRSVRRTRTRRRVAMLLPAAVVVVAATLAIQVPRGDNGEGPSHPSTPTPSNGALVTSNEKGVAVLTGQLDHLPQDMVPFSQIQFIRDGSELVYDRRSGGLESINVTTGNTRLVTACGGNRNPCTLMRLSPDGTRTAGWTRVGGKSGVQVRELATGHTSFLPTTGVARVQWAPNGNALAIAATKGIFVTDLSSGDMRVLYRYPEPNYHSLAPSWSPDGTALAFLNPRAVKGNPRATDWTLTTVHLDGTHVRALRDVGGCYCGGLAPPQVVWSPDGRKIAVTVIHGGYMGNARAGGLYSINPNGTDFTLINASVNQGGLAWQPRQN
jgi:hypothetical protein